MTPTTVGGILAAIRADASGEDLPDALVRLCVRSLPVSGVGLALMTEDGPLATVAASDAGSWQLEELQFSLDQGPCVDASRTGRPVLVPDLATTSPQKWPQFGAGAETAGIRAIFALPLQVGSIRLGVLDLYRDTAGELTRPELADGLTFADAATQLLLDLQAQDTAPGSPPPRGFAVLDDRAEVHQATGVISVRAAVNMAQALALLRGRAYADDRPIGDLALDVLDGLVLLGDDAHD